MYNLLMSGGDDTWDTGKADFDRSRFLEYTEKALAARFRSLDDTALAELMSYPALFSYEKPEDRPARIGWITDVERQQRLLKIQFHFDERFDPLEPGTMLKLLGSLDIQKFEVHRYHWAVKEVDLIEVLTNAGLLLSARKMRSTDFQFSRQTVLKASMIHKSMSHADLDTFILELGVNEINAGRDRGSRQVRAVGLAEYAVDNADQLTAGGHPLGYVVVESAARIDAQYPEGVLFDVDNATRQQFWSSLERDGYMLRDGHLETLAKASTAVASRAAANIERVTAPMPAIPKATGRASAENPKVFIVHGRDEGTKTDVARFIERLGLDAVILHEHANRGRTLTNKFMEVASEAAFAVVLITPDDVGGLSQDALRARARQNVIFELGFFIGLLGSHKVCALVKGDVERPSDFEAVVYISYGDGTAWRADLARELREAGIAFDPHKVF